LRLRRDEAPAASDELQKLGYVVLREVFGADEVDALASDIERVFETVPPDERVSGMPSARWEVFRYEMLNRSDTSRRAIAHPAILEVIEPLLGEDCHVIANTAWRQPTGATDHGGRFWHIDSGPHIPRDPAVPWDERIPYPVFAIAAHIYLWDCPLASGPTAVIPRSHTSGSPPPRAGIEDDGLEWNGNRAVPIVASAGDVALFVSDVWHRRMPSGEGDPGRFFLQCHYGRRDIAQRIRPTSVVNHLSPETVGQELGARERTLVGLHDPGFYDA
jgi:ectoine hydroxylase-related dioxygenase (phytanoyl-CoA dioxygenase family)